MTVAQVLVARLPRLVSGAISEGPPLSKMIMQGLMNVELDDTQAERLRAVLAEIPDDRIEAVSDAGLKLVQETFSAVAAFVDVVGADVAVKLLPGIAQWIGEAQS